MSPNEDYILQPDRTAPGRIDIMRENKRIGYVLENTHVYLLGSDGFADHIGNVESRTEIIPLVKRLRGRL